MSPAPPHPTDRRFGADDVRRLLAGLDDRDPSDVPDDVDSLQLAWLSHAVAEQWGLPEPLAEERVERIASVSDAVREINEAFAEAGA